MERSLTLNPFLSVELNLCRQRIGSIASYQLREQLRRVACDDQGAVLVRPAKKAITKFVPTRTVDNVSVNVVHPFAFLHLRVARI